MHEIQETEIDISNQPEKMHETEIDVSNQPKKMHETEIDVSNQPNKMHETEIDVSNQSNPSLSTPPSQALPSPQEIDVAENMNEQSPQAAAARASSPGVAVVRTIYCNDRDSNLNHGYFKVPYLSFTGNSIRTTKYGVVTFLPKCLFEQFRKVANLYFLVISILSSTPVSPATNPVSPISNVLPLIIVVFVSLVKEAWEDWKRLQNDEVGDIVKVSTSPLRHLRALHQNRRRSSHHLQPRLKILAPHRFRIQWRMTMMI
ncbi:hypothetical protein Vadar_006634 [Vaccinium darrowii]|uniref:Uncharacterized protein n=1 Tax=Vaccinium darrowii TaxID=229202 RepID=A0ACB7XFS1_9ERIC|nr:hypothetical protein Vadar_006634 [Vaccinium darrowii]